MFGAFGRVIGRAAGVAGHGMSESLGMIGKAASVVNKVPFLGSAVKAIPFVGTAATIADVGFSAYNMVNSGNKVGTASGNLPPLPFSPPSQMPGARSLGNPYPPRILPMNRASSPQIDAIHAQHQGQIGAFGGRGKHHGLAPAQAYQMILASGVGLGPAYFKQKLMAPSGYVIVRDPMGSGSVIAVPKQIARDAGLWKAHAKPPVSVRNWHAIKHAKAAIKQLHKVEKAAGIVHRATTKHHTAAIAHKKGHKK